MLWNINGDKAKVMRISTQSSPVQIMIVEQEENVEYLSYLYSTIKMLQNVHVKLNPGLS